VTDKVERWFMDTLPPAPAPARRDAGLEALSIGVLATGPVPSSAATALARIASAICGNGGTVVIPENSALLHSGEMLAALGLDAVPAPTLDYGQSAATAGFHVMAAPTDQAVEAMTGLGGTGVQLIIAHVNGPSIPGHPMIPTLQIGAGANGDPTGRDDLDFVVNAGDAVRDACRNLIDLICRTASQDYQPKLWADGCTEFQLTRGLLGVSL
jgi:hypothetical protein